MCYQAAHPSNPHLAPLPPLRAQPPPACKAPAQPHGADHAGVHDATPTRLLLPLLLCVDPVLVPRREDDPHHGQLLEAQGLLD